MQAVCDDRGLFMSVAVGAPGSVNDAGLLTRSSFFQIAKSTIPPFHFVLADGGYGNHPWMIRPYEEMYQGRPLSQKQRNFNYHHAKQRNVIERAFGRLKARWRKLRKLDMRRQGAVKDMIMSAFILHNFCEISDNNLPVDIEDMSDPPDVVQPPPQPETAAEAISRRDEARRLRDALCDLVHDRLQLP